jgi:hypothetical protein
MGLFSERWERSVTFATKPFPEAKRSDRSSIASWPMLTAGASMLSWFGSSIALPGQSPICSGPSRRFQVLGIEFVSLSEQMDTSTPTGKLVFTVLGAVAELERSLIAERVKAGVRNARAKGKRLGRPRRVLDASRIASLRAGGLGWRAIAKRLGVGVGTLYRVAPGRCKIRERVFGTQ